MSDNPFQSLIVEATDRVKPASSDLESVVEVLSKTSPFVRVVSIVMYLAGTLLMIVGAVAVVFGVHGGLSPLKIGIGVFCFALSFVYTLPASSLWTYANRIKVFAGDHEVSSLVSSLKAQESFWQFVSVVLLIAVFGYGMVFAALLFSTVPGM